MGSFPTTWAFTLGAASFRRSQPQKKEAAEEAVADEDIEVAVRAADILGKMHDDELEDAKEDEDQTDATVGNACDEHFTYEAFLHVGAMLLPALIFIVCV